MYINVFAVKIHVSPIYSFLTKCLEIKELSKTDNFPLKLGLELLHFFHLFKKIYEKMGEKQYNSGFYIVHGKSVKKIRKMMLNYVLFIA